MQLCCSHPWVIQHLAYPALVQPLLHSAWKFRGRRQSYKTWVPVPSPPVYQLVATGLTPWIVLFTWAGCSHPVASAARTSNVASDLPLWPCCHCPGSGKNKRLTIATKVHLYQALVVSVLLYVAETWTLLATDLRTLEAFHMRCQQQILGVRWIYHISNVTVSSILVSRQLASKLLAITSQFLAILPDWVRRSHPTRRSCPHWSITWSPAWSGLEASSWSTKQQMGRSGS